MDDMGDGVTMASQRRRVLLVIATLTYGGTEIQLYHLARRLKQQQYDVMVCCVTIGGPLAEDLRRVGVDVRILWKRHKLDALVLWKLVQVFRSFRPDVVHSFLFTANMWGRLGAWLCKPRGVVASIRSFQGSRGLLRVLIDRLLARITDRIICNSWAIAKHLAQGEGIREAQLAVIHNGVDTDWFDAWLAAHTELPLGSRKSAVGLFPDRRVVGMVCRFDRRKGIDVFLDACELLLEKRDDLQFLLVGDADPHQSDQLACKAQIMQRLERPPLDSAVVLPGFALDVRGFLAGMDVFVLASHTEGLPNALMEAMAMERPVVATSVGGVPELVRPEIDGVLVPPGDPRAVADAVLRLLGQPDLARAMARSARDRIRQNFSLAHMVSETTRIYDEVLRK